MAPSVSVREDTKIGGTDLDVTPGDTKLDIGGTHLDNAFVHKASGSVRGGQISTGGAVSICPRGHENRGDRSRRDSGKPPGVSFHRFPKDSELHKRWTAAGRRENLPPNYRESACVRMFSAFRGWRFREGYAGRVDGCSTAQDGCSTDR